MTSLGLDSVEQLSLWQRRLDNRRSSGEAVQNPSRKDQDSVLVFSSLSEAMNKGKTLRRPPPSPLQIQATPHPPGLHSAGLLAVLPAGSVSPVEQGSHSLPTSPIIQPYHGYAGFPSPFSIPKLLPSSKIVSPSARTTSLGSAGGHDALRMVKEGAQQTPEAAFSTLSIDESNFETRRSTKPSLTDARRASAPQVGTPHFVWEPESDEEEAPRSPVLSGATALHEPLSEGTPTIDSSTEQPKRKGRARMSQEKRRRLARRREREAAMIAAAAAASSSPSKIPSAEYGSVPHSAPAYITTFGARWQTSAVEVPSSPWWGSTTAASDAHLERLVRPSPQHSNSPLVQDRRSSTGSSFSYGSFSGGNSLGLDIRHASMEYGGTLPACSSPSPSLSPSSSSVNSPFDKAFGDAPLSSVPTAGMPLRGPLDVWSSSSPSLHQSAQFGKSPPTPSAQVFSSQGIKPFGAASPSLSSACWTPAPYTQGKPKVVIQPPTPQDAFLNTASSSHFRSNAVGTGSPAELTSSKRLSQVIVEGQESFFQPPMAGAQPALLRSSF